MGPLARWAVRKPKTALVAWFVMFVLVALLGVQFAGTYNDSFDLPESESSQAQELLAQTAAASAATGASAKIVWSPESGSAVAPDVIATMTPVLKDVAAVGSVSCVASPWGEQFGSDCQVQPAPDPAQVTPEQAAAMQAAAQAASPVSPDGTVAYATVAFGVAADSIPLADLTAVLDQIEAVDGTNGLTVGGNGAIGFAEQEPPKSEGVGVLVALIILLIAFGSIIAAGLPIVTALFGLGAGLLLVTFSANFADIATFGPTLAAMIGLGVGIDYALFVLNRFRQSRMAGREPRAAALESVNTAGRAVTFAAGTVIIALMGLLVLGIGFFNGLAIAAALTVTMVMLSALWLLPALISLLGARTLGWRLPWARKEKTWHAEGGGWAHYGRLLQRRPLLPTVLALAFVGLLALPAFSIRLGFSDDGGRPEGSVMRTGYDLLAEGFGPGSNGPFYVAVELPTPGDAVTLATAIEDIENTPGVASVLPTVEMLPLVLGPTDTVAALQVTGDYSPQDPATTELLTTLREETIPAFESETGASAYVGGFQAVVADFTTVIVDALPLFLSVVIGLGFLALVILFRAIVVPLTGALTSLLSLGAAMGVTVAVFQWGWFSDLIGVTSTGPIFPFLPVMVFAILFGLSMDYQVFLVSRMQEEWIHTKDNTTAVRRGLAGSGRVVAMAAAIMGSVFLAFVPTPTQEIKLFGVALASAVIVDAFVVRLVLVPSLMTLFGTANWWLPGWLQRVLPQIHIEGGGDEIADDVDVPAAVT